jgi:deoxyribonuclease V
MMSSFDGMEDPDVLELEQRRLAALTPPPWQPGAGPSIVGGAFVAFARGEQGPGHAGDHAVVGAAATRGRSALGSVVTEGRAPAAYRAGHLAAREGALLERALRALWSTGIVPDVVVVDATGRDHPRRAGLALHLGAVLDVPTVGATHRPLLASGPEPADDAGAWTELRLDGEVVGRWVRTQRGVRPLAVHAAWRTDEAVATEVVLASTAQARTPEPLRLARRAAREERSRRERATERGGRPW